MIGEYHHKAYEYDYTILICDIYLQHGNKLYWVYL